MKMQNMFVLFSIIVSIALALPAVPTPRIDDGEVLHLLLDSNAADEWRSGWNSVRNGGWRSSSDRNWRSWDGRGGFTALGGFAAWDLGLNPWDVPTTYSYPWYTGVVPWYR